MSPILSRLFYFGMIVLLGSCAGKNAFISKSILKDEYLKKIASNPDHEVQIIYTQVNKKDNSFKSVVGAIYQSFDGKDLYSTDQEKAANLLYMMVKNHAFSDGNKRIDAALFVYFLDKRGILYKDNVALVIDNNTLAAMTLMIALSHPNEKEIMCLLVMNMLENE